ncbi:hypothetical protein HELRODRAFT_185271 [Helobdella robusta]|uniref:Carboxypeptidase n=1 Tax=Helobdella robusta TaxID=6412 RepID=T1FML2_HELRO|nr:hypothetical protein HELRODRAFT_185271 [Helobdella robusta]ESO10740.1 hypothetical protein HELRODRAFT_185271 [Helobdella robusta]
MLNFNLLVILFLLFVLKLKSIISAPTEDEVTSLNRLSWKPTFRHYSGYLDAGSNKFLHYWFVESQNDPSKDPVVLWLNGGPGCSSLDGLLTEHGPFILNSNLMLEKNEFSWNLIANVLYLESPAGVGFSYTTDKNYTTSDNEVALHNHQALTFFFTKKFPEYSKNDFYITGESYAGIYLPTLALRLIPDASINFKGMAVGNGLLSYALNSNSLVYFAYDHGLIGEELFLTLVQKCCKGGNSTLGNCNFNTKQCIRYFSMVIEVVDELNVYNLYGKCFPASSSSSSSPPYSSNKKTRPHEQNLRKDFIYNRYFKFTKGLMKPPMSSARGKFSPPCIDDLAITKYLNDPKTQNDLHIVNFHETWSVCSALNYIKEYENVYYQFSEILKSKKYKVMVYNGDVDMACNFLGDQWFVQALEMKVLSNRQFWLYTDLEDKSQQVAGFVRKYQNLTFVTVKGAGHMVPTDKPYQALIMFTNFLSGVF